MFNVSSFEENNTLNEYYHFWGYNIIRILQAITGITGNTLTLIIIKNLKSRVNGHLVMAYLAVSDILVSCIAPFSMVTQYFNLSGNNIKHWKNLCIIKEYFYGTTMMFSGVSYAILSIDR